MFDSGQDGNADAFKQGDSILQELQSITSLPRATGTISILSNVHLPAVGMAGIAGL